MIKCHQQKIKEIFMSKRKILIKRCQNLALAGAVAVLTGLPAESGWAAGPGEGNTSGSISAGVQSGGQNTGNIGPGAGSGGAGNSQGAGISGPGGGPGAGNSGSGGGTGNAGPGGGPGGGSGSSAGTGNSGTDTASGSSGGSGSTASGTTSDSNAWKFFDGSYRMPDGSAILNVLRRGIDVSRWQGQIDWDQVAADDVSFVMLGTRSKGAVDPYFHRNIQNAARAGVQVGVYIYSLATTTEMAVAEADFVLDLIKDYPISYPVALDMEDDVQAVLSKEELAAIANAFCGRISDAGYYPIIYANENWLANYLDMSLMDYPVWVARYSRRPSYASPVMWQCTSTGSVNGINGNVDIDFQFRDFSDVIPANTWRTIGGNTYYYAGYAMQKDTWINDGDGWYFMDQDGLALKDWFLRGGERYYLDSATGKMQYGWKADGETWYYLGNSGAAVKGWIDDNGTWYFGDRTTGAMETGWLEEGGQTYYLADSGAMVTGWIRPDGTWRYMDQSGAMSRGWVNDSGEWYYLDQRGLMKTGWLEDGGQRYFLKGSGARVTGWRPIDNNWYYFDQEGRMATGWLLKDGVWYYLNQDGTMATGLIQVNNVWYYLNPDGAMAMDTDITAGDVTYHADGSGALSLVASEENHDQQNSEGSGQEDPRNQKVTGPGDLL